MYISMRNTIYLSVISIVIYCHTETVANPMFGPNIRNARKSEFPYIVALTRIANGETDPTAIHICTGSLITRQDVLIAAHCLEDLSQNSAEIRVGSTSISKGAKYALLWWLDFNKWSMYKKVKRSFLVNDIGNIRLQRSVPSNLRLGVLSSKSTEDFYNRDVLIAGWGANERSLVSKKMRATKQRVLNMNECRTIITELNGSQIRIHDRHICSNSNPFAVMHRGDDGAPVILDGEIIAIHMSTMPSLGPLSHEKLNIHTTINYYTDFIESVTDPNFHWNKM